MTRRGVVIAVVAVLLFAWVFLYRFNTLGGALGGFDNDHFLYMTIAKQVQAGEQPLRDFMDGVHGARPSLTYEFSAAAQRLFGNNLRSEAWLTVGGWEPAGPLRLVLGERTHQECGWGASRVDEVPFKSRPRGAFESTETIACSTHARWRWR